MENPWWNFSKTDNFETIDIKIYMFMAEKKCCRAGFANIFQFACKSSKFYTNKRFADGLTKKRSTHSSFPLSSDMKDFSAT